MITKKDWTYMDDLMNFGVCDFARSIITCKIPFSMESSGGICSVQSLCFVPHISSSLYIDFNTYFQTLLFSVLCTVKSQVDVFVDQNEELPGS